MKLFRSSALLAPFLALIPAIACAAAVRGYNPAVVAADARWVIHADLNALRASALGQELIAQIQKAQTHATGGIIGVDVQKVLGTVGTLTAYGSNLTPDPSAVDGTLIAQGTPELRKIAESILLQGTLAEPQVFTEVTDLPFPAYAITDAKAPEGRRTQVVVAFPPEPIVLVSKSKAQLVKARDVFRGTAASLAKTPTSPLNKLAAQSGGAYLFAASVVPTEPLFPEHAPQARILQLAGSGSLAVGERGADTFAHAQLFASSERNAEKLAKILEGMTSLLSLAESNDKQLAEFLTSTSVKQDKDHVSVQLAYPTERLVQMTQNLRAQAEARPTRATITMGKTIADWNAADAGPADSQTTPALSWRTMENVTLAHGSTITVGRASSGGKPGRIERVEIVPAGQSSAPLVFTNDFMRHRGLLAQFQFPGADGVYTLRVGYINDPERKTRYAVSVQEPRRPEKK